MTNLSGRSVVLLKVHPDQLEKASKEIAGMPNVTKGVACFEPLRPSGDRW